jgi:hypothetical protein
LTPRASVLSPAFFSHDRIGKKAGAVDVKREDQRRTGQCVCGGIEDDKSQRNGSVEDEVQRDVEIAPEIGLPGGARDRSVQAIANPADNDQHQRGNHVVQSDQCRRGKPDDARENRHVVGFHTTLRQPDACPVEAGLDDLACASVHHEMISLFGSDRDSAAVAARHLPRSAPLHHNQVNTKRQTSRFAGICMLDASTSL